MIEVKAVKRENGAYECTCHIGGTQTEVTSELTTIVKGILDSPKIDPIERLVTVIEALINATQDNLFARSLIGSALKDIDKLNGTAEISKMEIKEVSNE